MKSSMPKVLNPVQALRAANFRIEKLEIAFIMLLNNLRASKKVGKSIVTLEIPSGVLDSLEKMVLARPTENQIGK